MDDSTKTIIKVLGVAAGAYIVYEYLQSSGLWAQWFGTGFTDPAKFMAYCAANPTGTATYTDSTGKSTTVPCSTVNSSAHPSTSTPPTTGAGTTAAPAPSTDYAQAIAMMQTAAGGAAPQNLDAWAYYWQNGHPFTGSPIGFGVPGWISPTVMNQIISLAGGDRTKTVAADQFVAWLNQASPSTTAAAGVSGLGALAGLGWEGAYEPAPYAWSN